MCVQTRCGWVVLLAAACALLQPGVTGAAELEMNEAVTYAHAGVLLAVPRDFDDRHPAEESEVMRAVRTVAGKPVQAVSLGAYCVGPKDTAEDFADAMEQNLAANLAVRKFKVLKKTHLTIAGISGSARLLTYTFRGEATTAARAFFVRRLKADGVSICYVLTVEAAAQHDNVLLPVLDRVIKTMKLTAIQHPVLLPVRLSGKPVRNERLGFAVRPPIGWYVRPTPMGISMGQTDYLAGGQPSPLVTVVAAEVAEGTKSKACVKRALQPYLAVAGEGGLSVDILSQEVTKMGGNPAHQALIRMTPKGSPATKPGKEPPAPDGRQAPGEAAQLRVLRVICVAADKERPFRSYAMIMVCRTDEAKAVRAAMDAIAGGFEVLSSAATATRPADKKAAEEAAKKAAEKAAK